MTMDICTKAKYNNRNSKITHGKDIMSKVRCKNCGAVFDAKLSYCPYCGTMNQRGAYAEFRMKISSLIDSMFGLKEDVQKSVSRIILSSLLRSLVIIAAIIGIAFGFSRTAQVNYYNDPEYDQKAYEELCGKKFRRAFSGGRHPDGPGDPGGTDPGAIFFGKRCTGRPDCRTGRNLQRSRCSPGHSFG